MIFWNAENSSFDSDHIRGWVADPQDRSLKTLPFWHCFNLGGAHEIYGVQPVKEILPNYIPSYIDFKGKDVLIVGVRDGFPLLYAETQGAKSVTGLVPPNIQCMFTQTAPTLLKNSGSSAKLVNTAIEDLPSDWKGKFQLVIILDTINYSPDPALALDKLLDCSSEEVLLCVHSLASNDGMSWIITYANRSANGQLERSYAPNLNWLGTALEASNFNVTAANQWSCDRVRQHVTIHAKRINALPSVRPLSLEELPTDHGLEHETRVVVMSCARFKQAWRPFFTLFKKYWPDCPYQVTLVTDQGRYEGVDTIELGQDRGWASNCIAALNQINAKRIILFLEDLLIKVPVDTLTIRKLVRHSIDFNTGYLRLNAFPGPVQDWGGTTALGTLRPIDMYRVSLLIAIWSKETFLKILREGENPWQTEIEGSKRSAFITDPFLSVWSNLNPIEYFCTAIDKGVWSDAALDLLRSEGIPLDGITKVIPKTP